MEPTEQLDTIIPELGRLVAGVRRDQMTDPTPCAKWTVRDLLAHLASGGRMFAEVFRGGAVQDLSNPDPAVLGDDPAAAYDAAFADFTAATRAPGATDITIALPFGPIPGEAFLRLAAFDLLVHGWDVATATGQRYAPPPELVTEADAFARQAVGPEARAAGMFGPEIDAPAGASTLEALVAFAGRRP
jgi:uncharacterized protein (TIGR03086 family)